MTPMWQQAALSVLLGGAFAAGLLLLATRLPRWSAPTLTNRIAPYVRDIADPRGLTPLAPLGRSPWWTGRDRLIAWIGGAESVTHRLAQAGIDMDAVSFRGRQLVWALVGAGGGAVVTVILVMTGRISLGAVVLPLVAGLTGAVLYDLRLTYLARARIRRISEELPTILEFLALCLSAGESLRDALTRVGEVGSGELTSEIRAAVLATGTGSTLSDALLALARRVDLPALSRAIDHVVAAVERGAPLAQVLQAQASDARDDAKRTLIEQAGRKEIQMLLPVVFLILPLSVLFAVFPGVVMLRLGIE